MISPSKHKRIRVLLLCLYVLASLGVGFSHGALRLPGPDLSAFVLPDGTLPIICSTNKKTNGEESDRTAAHQPRCDACMLTAAPGLPAPGGAALLIVRPTIAEKPCLPDDGPTRDRVRAATLGARGPPSV